MLGQLASVLALVVLQRSIFRDTASALHSLQFHKMERRTNNDRLSQLKKYKKPLQISSTCRATAC